MKNEKGLRKLAEIELLDGGLMSLSEDSEELKELRAIYDPPAKKNCRKLNDKNMIKAIRSGYTRKEMAKLFDCHINTIAYTINHHRSYKRMWEEAVANRHKYVVEHNGQVDILKDRKAVEVKYGLTRYAIENMAGKAYNGLRVRKYYDVYKLKKLI